MSKTKAEFLTGYEIRSVPARPGCIGYGAFSAGRLVARAAGVEETVTLRHLVRFVYLLHSRQVLAAYQWRCARCGRTRPLHIHHKRSRSLGGTHRRENLEPVCWDCHRSIHAHRAVPEQGSAESLFSPGTLPGADDEF